MRLAIMILLLKKGVRQAQKMRIFDSDGADLGPELADLGLGA